MERIGHASRSWEDAEAWGRQQNWEMTPSERFEVVKVLLRRAYGDERQDIRAYERSRTRC